MRVRNQDLTFDIFDYCYSEDTIISSFPIDENESVQLTEKVKVYILVEERVGALAFDSPCGKQKGYLLGSLF